MVDLVAGREAARSLMQRGGQVAWFLGAGASAAANIPTAGDMILDFKARMFCAHTNIPRQEVDATDPMWEERITAFFDGAHGLPPVGDPSEYAAAFEAVFPDPRDRRSYIEEMVRHGTPSFGHRVLASLITDGMVPCLFTTNFDPVVEHATVVADGLVPPEHRAHLTVAALDSVERAVRCVRDNAWPVLIKLHGDYKSERLKNVDSELRAQDEQLRRLLVEALTRFGLVVVGYSGRDQSVMEALEEAIAVEGSLPAGLWWVKQPSSSLLPRVASLLDKAETKGIDSFVVESANFDEFAGNLEREASLDERLTNHIQALRPSPIVVPVEAPAVEAAEFPVLRCSALELLDVPEEARRLEVSRSLSLMEAVELVRDAKIWATVAPWGKVVAAFGQDDELERAFAPVGGQLRGTVRLRPLEDSGHRGLLYDAFVRAVTRRKPLAAMLRSRGHTILAKPPDPDRTDDRAQRKRQELKQLREAYGSALRGDVPSIHRDYAEAIRIRLEPWLGQWFCVYEPFTWVDLPRFPSEGSEEEDDDGLEQRRRQAIEARSVAQDWRRERWARRYNPFWNSVVDAWAQLLAPSDAQQFTHHFDGEGINAAFRICPTTVWSRPANTLKKAKP